MPRSSHSTQSPRESACVWRLPALTLALSGAFLLPSCSHSGSGGASPTSASVAPQVGAASTAESSLARFRAAVAQESSDPGRDLADVPLPPGVPADALLAHGADDPRAFLSQADAVRLLSAGFTFPSRTPPPQPDEEVERRSVLAFVEGREFYLQEKYFDAIQRLEEAQQLDPGAIPVLRLLAAAYRASAGEGAAARFEREILALDPTDQEAAYRLGRAALMRSAIPEAVACLYQASKVTPGDEVSLGSRILSRLAALPLGTALAEAGCDQAALEAWEPGLASGGSLPASTRWQREGALYLREFVDVIVRAGDAQVRLGRLAEARDLYQRALDAANPDRSGLLARLAYLDARAGRPLSAQQRVLDLLIDPAAPGTTDLSPLARYVAGLADSALFAAAVEEQALANPARAALSQTALALLPAERGEAILISSLAAQQGALNASDVLRLASGRGDAGLMLRLGLRWARTNASPQELARALSSVTGDPERVLAAFESLDGQLGADSFTQAAQSLVLLDGGYLTDAHDLLHSALQRAPQDLWLRLALARVQTERGLTQEASTLLAAVDAEATMPDPAAYDLADLWARLGDAQRALDAIESASRSDDVMVAGSASARRFMLRKAETLITLRNYGEAVQVLRDGLAADRTNESAYALALSVLGPDGSAPDADQYVDLARTLARTLPDSRTLRYIRAWQGLISGNAAQAETDLRTLAEQDITWDEPLTALVRQWTETGKFTEAQAFLAGQLQQRPGDRRLLFALSRVLQSAGRPAEAVSLLEPAARATPEDIPLARQYSRALRASGREADARSALRAAVGRLPESVKRAQALAAEALEASDSPGAVKELSAGLGLVPAADDREFDGLLALAADAQQRGADAAASEFIESAVAARRAAGRPVSADASMLELRSLVILNASAQRLGEALAQARTGDVERDGVIAYSLLTALDQRSRTDDGILIADQVLALDRALVRTDIPVVVWRLNAATRHSQPQVAVDLVRRVAAAGLLDRLTLGGDDRSSVSNVLYSLSGSFSNNDDQASSEYLLAEILRTDPDHAGANNDLAYNWADRGERLEEAVPMILKSLAAQPDNDSFLDSLGWARYKQGRYDDQVANPTLASRGAISLLKAAVDTPEGAASPAILDHYGDALWRAGRIDEARAAWGRVESAYKDQLSRIDPQDTSDFARDVRAYFDRAFRPIAENAARKLEALAAGNEPPVAPVVGSGW